MENKLSTEEVAKELKVKNQTILRYIKKKFLKAEKVVESPLKYHYEIDIEEIERVKKEMQEKFKKD